MPKGTILLIIAHPDDEIFVSGTACICSDLGFPISLVCITDGEGAACEPLRRSGVCVTDSTIARVRQHELALSSWVLGIKEVLFLSYPDVSPKDWNSRAWDQNSLTEDLAKLIEERNPALICTHGPKGGYGHPAHIAVNKCVIEAQKRVRFPGSIFSFSAQPDDCALPGKWWDQPSDVLVDVRGNLMRRVASLSYHQSQANVFLHPSSPQNMRDYLRAALATMTYFSSWGRARLPIVTPRSFFRRFPVEGLALQKAPDHAKTHFFREHFLRDSRFRFCQRLPPTMEGCLAFTSHFCKPSSGLNLT